MEIVIGIIVVVVILIVIGKMKGAPDPSSMSEAAIFQRMGTEGAWISKYMSQPLSSQQSASLERMYEEKTAYVASLKSELIKRQVSQGTHAIQQELTPILQRATELVKDGRPEAEAQTIALKEWGEPDRLLQDMEKSRMAPSQKVVRDHTPKMPQASDAGSIPSPALAAIIGIEPVTRAQVIKKLWDYIKANNLQDTTNKRVINADDKLLAVFGKPQVTMFELAGIVGKHLR